MADVSTLKDAMTRALRLAAAALLSLVLGGLALAGPALAEGHGWGHERGRGWGREEGWRRGPPMGGPPGRGEGRWGYAPPAEAYGGYPGMPAYPHRLPPPGYGVRRGGMIPPQYRGAIVPDYGRHRLRPPPPGFAWVRMGDRYMLVSRATGQIFDVIGE